MGCPLAVHGGSPPGGYPGWPDGALIRRPGKLSSQQRKFASPQAAFRSGLEEKIALQLKTAGVPFGFETQKVAYLIPASNHTYTPDFILPNGIIIETKGLFSSEDRKKHKLVKAQHPQLDIRFVFSNAQARISKKSPTTYAKWCDTLGIPWAHKTIPVEWIAAAQSRGATEVHP